MSNKKITKEVLRKLTDTNLDLVQVTETSMKENWERFIEVTVPELYILNLIKQDLKNKGVDFSYGSNTTAKWDYYLSHSPKDTYFSLKSVTLRMGYY
jgi:hypothetical protein